MKRNSRMMILLIILFLVSLSATAGVVYAVYNIVSNAPLDQDTTVSKFYVGGKSPSAVKRILKDEFQLWTNDGSIVLDFNGTKINIPTDYVYLDVDKTVDALIKGKANDIVLNIQENNIRELMNSNIYNEYNSEINFERLISDLKMELQILKLDIQFDLLKYIDDYSNVSEPIKEVTIENLIESSDIINKLSNLGIYEITIEPHSQFSLQEYIMSFEEGLHSFTEKELSIIGTGIYSLIIETNFNNIKKSISKEPPTYLVGNYESAVDDSNYELKLMESKVDYENNDLTFYNPNNFRYTIDIQHIQDETNKLKFIFEGIEFQVDYKKQIEVEGLESPPIIRYMKDWESGREEVIPGKHGYRIITYRIIPVRVYNEDIGNFEITYDKIILNEDIYIPKETIIMKSALDK